MTGTKKKTYPNPPKKSPHIPATAEMLFTVRDELKQDMRAMQSNVDAQFSEVRKDLALIKSSVHRIALRCEVQDARNLYVLDGYTSLNDRIERNENDIFELKTSMLKK